MRERWVYWFMSTTPKPTPIHTCTAICTRPYARVPQLHAHMCTSLSTRLYVYVHVLCTVRDVHVPVYTITSLCICARPYLHVHVPCICGHVPPHTGALSAHASTAGSSAVQGTCRCVYRGRARDVIVYTGTCTFVYWGRAYIPRDVIAYTGDVHQRARSLYIPTRS